VRVLETHQVPDELTCLYPCRAHLQPAQQQLDLASCHDGDTRYSQRRIVELGPLRPPHLHPPLRLGGTFSYMRDFFDLD